MEVEGEVEGGEVEVEGFFFLQSAAVVTSGVSRCIGWERPDNCSRVCKDVASCSLAIRLRCFSVFGCDVCAIGHKFCIS